MSSALADLAAARERTLAQGTASIGMESEHRWPIPPFPGRRRGGLARKAGKAVLGSLARRYDFRHLSSEGVIDFVGRRYMLDHGSYAVLYADGTLWAGRCAHTLATLPPHPRPVGDPTPTPLWVVDLLAGASRADEAGTEWIRGAPCRRIDVTADLSLASRAAPDGLAAPAVERFEDLLALRVEVWLDAAHIRRVRRVSELHTETLDLWDFGTNVEGLDWKRLPTFRSESP